MNRLITTGFVATMLAVSSLAAEINPTVSDQLIAAKQQLAELRVRYKDKHPKVRAQLRTVEEWERVVAAQQEESAELRAARAELIHLREQYEDQVRKVADLERQLKQRQTESAELQLARERFAKTQRIYRERHPKYQEALQTVRGLEKQQSGRR